jgi:hypothetical protein
VSTSLNVTYMPGSGRSSINVERGAKTAGIGGVVVTVVYGEFTRLTTDGGSCSIGAR